jgi:hypothetical protein
VRWRYPEVLPAVFASRLRLASAKRAAGNPVKASTPALGDRQARKLLEAPPFSIT